MLLCLLFLACLVLVVFVRFATLLRRHRGHGRTGRRNTSSPASVRCHPKPPWVIREVIRLKALMPDDGCRTLAEVFNRRFEDARDMTVRKTFVSNVVRKHQYAIHVARQQIKHTPPQPMPLNLVWGVDLTGKSDAAGATHMLLGVIEHGARACLALQRLADRSTAGILLELIRLMRRFGVPRTIRTDNEGIFTSWLFRSLLALLGVRHQRTDPHCPWQNGRVERFFGTLKSKLDRWIVASAEELDLALPQFRFWYNHVRPHQHLTARTPAQVWAGISRGHHAPRWFEAWDGLLCGDYFGPS